LIVRVKERHVLSTTSKTNIGVIGCGQISSIYFEAQSKFDILQYVACSDIDMDRARSQAKKYHVPKVSTVDELLADPDIDIVLNLTIPNAHASIAVKALRAGKSTYSEKPLAINRKQGKEILDHAQTGGLHVGCAPDTFLGGGIQTCIKLINDGAIGVPIGATAFMMSHGPESWHANPEFFYHVGGGPMFDMGPYYLTALIAMLGPVRRVSGLTSISFPERTITSQPKYGTRITVETPTHIAGLLDFASGAVGTIVTSFDVWSHKTPRIEIYGTTGTLSIPDPNTFGGPVSLYCSETQTWTDVPLTHAWSENSRGIGLADMAHAMHTGRMHRASGALAYHVLDIMEALHDSSREGKHIELTSTCDRPAPLHPGTHNWYEER
jgi:predicted dehydrogenase